jgi:hypothetical protein
MTTTASAFVTLEAGPGTRTPRPKGDTRPFSGTSTPAAPSADDQALDDFDEFPTARRNRQREKQAPADLGDLFHQGPRGAAVTAALLKEQSISIHHRHRCPARPFCPICAFRASSASPPRTTPWRRPGRAP